MPPEIISAIIGAGSQLIGGISSAQAQKDTNKTNLQIARETNAANQQLQDSTNKWNLEQWNRQNEYNSASAQRERLEAAGFNPYFTNGQVAAGSAQSASLTSAPAPTMQGAHVEPVNYLSGVPNAGNDFITTYLNYRMNAANVKKAEADADLAQSNADAVSGYKKDEAYSNIAKNGIQMDLFDSQRALNDIDTELKRRWGTQQAIADLELTAANTLKSTQDRHTSEADEKKKLAEAVEIYAKTHNIKLQSDQLASTIPLLIKKMKLENAAQESINVGLSQDALFEKYFGGAKRAFGLQQLNLDTQLKRKDNDYYMYNAGLKGFGTFLNGAKALKK